MGNLDLAAIVAELRTVVREELLSALSLQDEVVEDRSDRKWYPTDLAWVKLSLVSAEKLRLLRRSGRFKEGVHYRCSNISPNTKRPTYEWNINKCEEVLQTKLSKVRLY